MGVWTDSERAHRLVGSGLSGRVVASEEAEVAEEVLDAEERSEADADDGQVVAVESEAVAVEDAVVADSAEDTDVEGSEQTREQLRVPANRLLGAALELLGLALGRTGIVLELVTELLGLALGVLRASHSLDALRRTLAPFSTAASASRPLVLVYSLASCAAA